jgi:polyketide synthase PksJ
MIDGAEHGLTSLSPSQLRWWSLARDASRRSVEQVITIGWNIRGELDVSRLEDALIQLGLRHEPLHTVFRSRMSGLPAQQVTPSLLLKLDYSELIGGDVAEISARRRRLATDLRKSLSDLAKSPLLRASLSRFGAEEYTLLVAAHQIVFDGWSIRLFEKDLFTLYAWLTQDSRVPLPRLTRTYSEYAAAEWGKWQDPERLAAWLDSGWRDMSRKGKRLLAWPGRRIPENEAAGESHRLSIDMTSLRPVLRELRVQYRVTEFMALYANLLATVYSFTRQTDIVVGTVALNRSSPGLLRLIGAFSNPILIRTCLESSLSVSEVMASSRASTVAALTHQDIPLALVARELNPAQSVTPYWMERFRPYDLAFTVVPPSRRVELSDCGLSLSPYSDGIERAPAQAVALSISVVHTANRTTLQLAFRTDTLSAAVVAAIGARFIALFQHAVNFPGSLADLVYAAVSAE